MRADIHQVVFDRLTTGAWAPGERVSIEALARELGVSPTPVREALVSLERSGLIQYRAQRGYVAAPPLDEQQIEELLDARLVVERAALTRAFRSSWEDLATRLDAVHRAHVQAAERLRRSETMDYALVREYFDADLEFHRTFFAFAANEFLTAMHSSLGVHAHRMRHSWDRGRGHLDLDETIAEHGSIALRVAEHDHDGAQEALQAHLRGVCQRFVQR